MGDCILQEGPEHEAEADPQVHVDGLDEAVGVGEGSAGPDHQCGHRQHGGHSWENSRPCSHASGQGTSHGYQGDRLHSGLGQVGTGLRNGTELILENLWPSGTGQNCPFCTDMSHRVFLLFFFNVSPSVFSLEGVGHYAK